MTIYTTRHGQTDLNIQGITCGRQDCPLNDTGLEHAKALAERVKALPIDMVVASPLLRARQTAELAAEAIGCELIFDDRLLELDYGAMDGTPWMGEAFAARRRHFAARLPEGESVFQLVQRTYNFLDEVMEANAGENLLLVTHGLTCKVIHTYFHDLDNDEFYDMMIDNCQLMEYTV